MIQREDTPTGEGGRNVTGLKWAQERAQAGQALDNHATRRAGTTSGGAASCRFADFQISRRIKNKRKVYNKIVRDLSKKNRSGLFRK